jgi:hypothetical protein
VLVILRAVALGTSPALLLLLLRRRRRRLQAGRW